MHSHTLDRSRRLPLGRLLSLIGAAVAMASCVHPRADRAVPAPGAAPHAQATQTPPKPPTATAPDGVVIAYERQGSGPPLILLHGGGQNRRSWSDRGYVSRLEKSFTVITMDERGTGGSGKPRSLEQYALDHVLAD